MKSAVIVGSENAISAKKDGLKGEQRAGVKGSRKVAKY